MNGLSFEPFLNEVLKVNGLTDDFEFLNDEDPDFIIFGPYGDDVPKPGIYQTIGYYCENIKPDLDICDWAFGIVNEDEVANSKYQQIKWHAVGPGDLIKAPKSDNVLLEKRNFCNFVYSFKAPYREEFFKQLSKYKKVDAPGKSMNNMPSIDYNYKGSTGERKRQFIKNYKFTIAFENYIYPGYHTEKLFDPMMANSLPIYCGDPEINETFNTKSFINLPDHMPLKESKLIRGVELISQRTLKDIMPGHFKDPVSRIQRKLKSIGRKIKMQLQLRNFNYSPLIDKIIEIDRNDELYLEYVREPWLNRNSSIESNKVKERWAMIFNSTK